MVTVRVVRRRRLPIDWHPVPKRETESTDMVGNIDRLLGREQIELLRAIARSGSFSAAAVTLGVTTSSVSQQVKRLESDAGCMLLKRERHGVSVTPQCTAVLSYARAVAALSDELRHRLGTSGS